MTTDQPAAAPQPLPPIEAFNKLKAVRHGQFLYNVHDTYIGRSLELYDEFSEGEVEMLGQICRPGDVVLDVGANIGALTIPIAKLVGPQGAVLAFEPQRMIFQALCANIALNNLTNVYAYQTALGEAPGNVLVPVLDVHKTNNFGGLELGTWEAGESVEVKRLDALTLPRLRLIKVDVEGMETQVLKGATGLIEKFKPAIYVENDRPAKRTELIQFIDSLGYDAYWHLPPLFNPNNAAKNSENVFSNLVSINMLCIPRDQGSNIANMQKVEVPK